jgi:hypothetical protein
VRVSFRVAAWGRWAVIGGVALLAWFVFGVPGAVGWLAGSLAVASMSEDGESAGKEPDEWDDLTPQQDGGRYLLATPLPEAHGAFQQTPPLIPQRPVHDLPR